MAYLRKNVWKLGAAWPPELLWYARAVKAMKALPLNNRLSWGFYGGIHGFDPTAWSDVGHPAPTAKRPPKADQSKYWNQCQHGSWYFLPWHRGYLMAFEKVVRSVISGLPGNPPQDWALPYWNYFKAGENKLPAEFASQSWPDGATGNPLFETFRFGPNDDGNVYVEFTGQFAVEENTALERRKFVGAADGGSPGFGGPETDHFTHSGSHHGGLESQPHDMVHVNVGGINKPGLMSDPRTAGLDPIFWLHHANIDRLWEVWKSPALGGSDPTSTKWLKGPASLGGRAFVMPVPGNPAWTYTPADVAKLSVLDYSYDDLTPPPGVNPPTQRLQSLGVGLATARQLVENVAAMPRNVEPLGASDVGIPIAGKGVESRVALKPEVRQKVASSLMAAQTAAPDRVFLNLENVRAARDGTVLSVYVNVPKGADPAGHPELKAGSVALFGARAASEADGEHAGEGLTFSLEISQIVDRLHLAGGLGDHLDVSVVSRNPVPADAKVTIGRIGVYRQQG